MRYDLKIMTKREATGADIFTKNAFFCFSRATFRLMGASLLQIMCCTYAFSWQMELLK